MSAAPEHPPTSTPLPPAYQPPSVVEQLNAKRLEILNEKYESFMKQIEYLLIDNPLRTRFTIRVDDMNDEIIKYIIKRLGDVNAVLKDETVFMISNRYIEFTLELPKLLH
jgi:hypothetical protein